MIKEHFSNTDKSELVINEEIGDGFDGIVFQVKSKDNGFLGSLVWIADNVDAGEVAHEAVHVAMDIMSDIGFVFDPNNQEPLAYMTGWVADCIWQVKTGKFKELQLMEITDLKIGDVERIKLPSPQGERLSIPMEVVGLFSPNTVTLDFEGNEGDVWEEKCENLVFDKDNGKESQEV